MVLKMIETPRLTLRQWLPEDYSYFAQMSKNPQVMQYFPKLLTRTESDAFIDKVKAVIELQGWRLDQAYWGKGYATEAAQAVLHLAFRRLKLQKVVSFTAFENSKSERLMRKIGMRKVNEFQHPALAKDHPLSWHVLYEILETNFVE